MGQTSSTLCTWWVQSVFVFAEESKLTDRRILVQFQMVTASRLIPSHLAPSFASVATQTVVLTYANASVEVVNVRCMPGGSSAS